VKPSRRLVDAGFRALNTVHRFVVHVTNGHLGRKAFGMPVVELHTIGRKSGAIRSTMLTVPVVDGSSLVLVASKGGNDRDPDWFANIVAHPDVEVTYKGERRPMRARVATPQEKTELWPRAVTTYKHYASYQRRTTRDIPLVVCDLR
jgi:deazaflavin-dependent oxidoreductase (nitroreductase family)